MLEQTTKVNDGELTKLYMVQFGIRKPSSFNKVIINNFYKEAL